MTEDQYFSRIIVLSTFLQNYTREEIIGTLQLNCKNYSLIKIEGDGKW